MARAIGEGDPCIIVKGGRNESQADQPCYLKMLAATLAALVREENHGGPAVPRKVMSHWRKRRASRRRSTRGSGSDTTNLDHHRLNPWRIPRRVVASRSLHPSRDDEDTKISAVHVSPLDGRGMRALKDAGKQQLQAVGHPPSRKLCFPQNPIKSEQLSGFGKLHRIEKLKEI